MKRILTSLVLLSCCAGTVYAGTPNRTTPRPGLAPVDLRDAALDASYMDPVAETGLHAITPQAPRDSHEALAHLAYKISYIGSVILTADRVVRSVDSVLDSMKLTRPDGTRMSMNMEPASHGFEVMIKLSRPIDF